MQNGVMRETTSPLGRLHYMTSVKVTFACGRYNYCRVASPIKPTVTTTTAAAAAAATTTTTTTTTTTAAAAAAAATTTKQNYLPYLRFEH